MTMTAIQELNATRARFDRVRRDYYLGVANLDAFCDAEEALVRAELRWGLWLGRADLVAAAQDKLDEIAHTEEIIQDVIEQVGGFLAEKKAKEARSRFRLVN